MQFLRGVALATLVVNVAATEGLDDGYYCPVSGSRQADAYPKAPSFLQEPLAPLEIDVSSYQPPPGAQGPFQVDFKPAHFTCTKCDPHACKGAMIMCDISSCTGKFYTKECWCKRNYALNRPLWRFRQSDAKFLTDTGVSQFFCDDDCSGGVCDTPGQMCQAREDACKPWWWCGMEPPKEEPVGGLGNSGEFRTGSFLQEGAQTVEVSQLESRARSGISSGSTLAQRLRSRMWRAKASSASRKAMLETRVAAAQQVATEASATAESSSNLHFEPNDFGKFNFENGRFVCGSASLPPKFQAPDTMLWNERGYIVMEKSACSGGVFEVQCFCWDEFKYFSGADPLVSELMCDETCSFGGCDGRHCSKHPPPPLPPPVAGKPVEVPLRKTKNKMEPSRA